MPNFQFLIPLKALMYMTGHLGSSHSWDPFAFGTLLALLAA
jgi:hypothetical protein